MEAWREVSFVAVPAVVSADVVDDAEVRGGGGLDSDATSLEIWFVDLCFLSFFGFSWLFLAFLLSLFSTSLPFSSILG